MNRFTDEFHVSHKKRLRRFYRALPLSLNTFRDEARRVWHDAADLFLAYHGGDLREEDSRGDGNHDLRRSNHIANFFEHPGKELRFHAEEQNIWRDEEKMIGEKKHRVSDNEEKNEIGRVRTSRENRD